MQQVKIFHDTKHDILEIEINNWLEENIDVKITEIRWHNSDPKTVMIIYYK